MRLLAKTGVASWAHARLGFETYEQVCYGKEKSSGLVKQAAKAFSLLNQWVAFRAHLAGLVRRRKNRYADLRKE